MKRAARTIRPLRVSSFTSTVLLEVLTSIRLPALVAPIRYSRAAPPPASTSTSTKSPFAIRWLFPIRGDSTLSSRARHASPLLHFLEDGQGAVCHGYMAARVVEACQGLSGVDHAPPALAVATPGQREADGLEVGVEEDEKG